MRMERLTTQKIVGGTKMVTITAVSALKLIAVLWVGFIGGVMYSDLKGGK